MKDPAFLFYSSDFLTGTSNLTIEEKGQYIWLLCLQHQLGHLDEKTIRLNVGNVSVDVLKKFKKDENELFYNERLDSEIDKRANFVDSRRENGKLGGRPKKPIGKPNGKPKKNLLVDENVNENIDINYYENKELNNLFLDFLELRRKLKAVNSERAINSLLKTLSNYDDETKMKMIEKSIKSSWKDVYELKDIQQKDTVKQATDTDYQRTMEMLKGGYGNV